MIHGRVGESGRGEGSVRMPDENTMFKGKTPSYGSFAGDMMVFLRTVEYVKIGWQFRIQDIRIKLDRSSLPEKCFRKRC